MELNNTFKKAIQALKNKPQIIIPSLLFIATPLIILLLVGQLTGFFAYTQEFISMAEVISESDTNILEFFEEQGFDYKSIFTKENMLIAIVAAGILLSCLITFAGASLSMITLYINNKPTDLASGARLTAKKIIPYPGI